MPMETLTAIPANPANPAITAITAITGVLARIDRRRKRRLTLVAGLVLLLAAGDLALAQDDVGLSSVRAQQFVNQSLGAFPAEAFDRFAEVLAVGDFNGDGADDLAAGTPNDHGIFGATAAEVGAVTLRYGRPSGPGILGGLHGGPPDAVFLQSSTLDFPELEDHFGRSLAACDFNNDGFDDLAIGAPDEDIGNQPDTGAVEIHYGTAAGLNTDATTFFHQESAGFPVLPTEPHQFGRALACGDWNGDRLADLAIGSPFASPAISILNAGIVLVVNGSANGLTPAGSYFLSEDTADMPGASEDGDLFGYTLVRGNFNRDSFEDLAIGSPGETISFQTGAGALHVLLGSSDGLVSALSAFYGETSLGGLSEAGDQFTYALAADDFDGDGLDDLAIGVPTEADGTIEASGQIVVIYGQNANPGFDLTRTQFFDQDSIFGPGAGEVGDFFGQSLAGGDFDGDGRADLAIGHPGESIQNLDDGAMTVVMGSDGGLLASHHRGLAGGVEGLPGNAQVGDRNFAHELAAGDFDGDGYQDLTISSPHEDVGVLVNAGGYTVLYGSLLADGFDSGNTLYWTNN